MSGLFPILETSRLVLNELTISDDHAISELRSDETVNKYLDRQKVTSLSEAQYFIDRINQGIVNGKSFYWTIRLKETGKLIGTICLWNLREDGFTIEIGYEMHPKFHGKGLMTEALVTVIDYALGVKGFKTILAYTHPGNEKSTLLLERNGFKRDKELENTSDEDLGGLIFYALRN